MERLMQLAQLAKQRQISELFVNNDRAAKFAARDNGFYLDYSKQNIDQTTLSALFDLCEQRNLTDFRQRMFAGGFINNTENRQVLHTALRAPHAVNQQRIGDELAAQIERCKLQCQELVSQIHQGQWRGFTNQPITDVIAIGIGGSFYGNKLCHEGLKSYPSKLNVHYVSNIDPHALTTKLAKLNAATTLVVVISKSFTTLETLENALDARQWLQTNGCPQAAMNKHFIAVSSNIASCKEFGIDEHCILPMWDWVGGRFSLWSAVGLPIALAYGYQLFQQLLAGAYAADNHFLTTPLTKNIPVLMALCGIWNRSFMQHSSLAILPYDNRIRSLPAYLQQIDMESNGKACTRDLSQSALATAPIIFGQEGSNGQHAFMQQLHQGTEIIPAEFILIANDNDASQRAIDKRKHLIANGLAQSEALMTGTTSPALPQYQVTPGNSPSLTLVIDSLTAHNLGKLLAFYEHKIFVQGVIWQLNSYDQWGVELGKKISKQVVHAMDSDDFGALSTSSQTLINIIKQMRS